MHTLARTHARAQRLPHLDGQQSEFRLSKKISDLPFERNWTEKGIFSFLDDFFLKSTNIFKGLFVPLQGLCFPPRLISRHETSSPNSSS